MITGENACGHSRVQMTTEKSADACHLMKAAIGEISGDSFQAKRLIGETAGSHFHENTLTGESALCSVKLIRS